MNKSNKSGLSVVAIIFFCIFCTYFFNFALFGGLEDYIEKRHSTSPNYLNILSSTDNKDLGDHITEYARKMVLQYILITWEISK